MSICRNLFVLKEKLASWMFVQLRKEPESLEQFSRATRLKTVLVSSENINVGSGLTRGLHSRPRGYRNHSGGKFVSYGLLVNWSVNVSY